MDLDWATRQQEADGTSIPSFMTTEEHMANKLQLDV